MIHGTSWDNRIHMAVAQYCVGVRIAVLVVINTVTRVMHLMRLKALGFGRPDLPMPAQARSCLTSEFAEENGLLEELPRRDPAIWRRAPHEGSA